AGELVADRRRYLARIVEQRQRDEIGRHTAERHGLDRIDIVADVERIGDGGDAIAEIFHRPRRKGPVSDRGTRLIVLRDIERVVDDGIEGAIPRHARAVIERIDAAGVRVTLPRRAPPPLTDNATQIGHPVLAVRQPAERRERGIDREHGALKAADGNRQLAVGGAWHQSPRNGVPKTSGSSGISARWLCSGAVPRRIICMSWSRTPAACTARASRSCSSANTYTACTR